jgi:hypothetical protein
MPLETYLNPYHAGVQVNDHALEGFDSFVLRLKLL